MGFQLTALLILLAFYGCYFVKLLRQSTANSPHPFGNRVLKR